MILFKPWQAILFLTASLLIIILSIPGKKDLGLYHFNSFEYEKAVTYLNEVEGFNSDDVFVLKKLKEYSLIQGDVDKAYQTQLHLLSLKPRNKEYLEEAEKLADWSGRPKMRLDLKERRSRLIMEENLKEGQRLILEVASGYRFLKDFLNADRLFQEIGKYEDKEYLETTIRYFLNRKDAKKSLFYLEKYNQDYPGNPEISYYYYQTMIFQGNIKGACIVLLNNLFPKEKFENIDVSRITNLLRNSKDFFYENRNEKIEKLILHLYSFSNEEEFKVLLDNVKKKVIGLPALLVKLGKNAEKEGKIEFSEELFQKGQRWSKQDFREINFDLAQHYLERKNYSRAINCLESLTARYPLNRQYWEMLAEAYQESGQKEKAIKAFMQLYKLQKKKVEQVYIHSIFTEFLFADVTQKPNSKLYYPLPKRKKYSKEEEKLLNVEDRIVNSIYGLPDINKRLLEFDNFLRENPKSLSARKGKAYTLFELGEGEKGKLIFKEIFSEIPEDPDANQVLISDWVQQKQWEKVSEAKIVLENRLEKEDLDLTLSEYYFEKDKPQYWKFCAQTKDEESQIECLFRKGKYEEALERTKELQVKDPGNCSYLTRRLYLETEIGDLEWARDEIQKNSPCINRKTKLELERFIYSQNLFRKSGQFWRWEQIFGLLDTNQFTLADAEFSLTRKLKDWSIGLRANPNKVVWNGDTQFTFINLELTYFFANSSGLSIGPTFSLGDKEGQSGFLVKYFYNYKTYFFSLNYFSKNPIRITRDMVIEPSAFSSGGEFYGNYRSNDRDWNFIGLATLKNISYRNNKSFYSQFNMEGLRRFYSNETEKPLELHSGLQINQSNLSSPKPIIVDNYLKKSLAIHGVLKAEYNYPDNFMPRKWSGFLRFGFGGDLKRNIDFFKSLQVTGRINKAISKRSKIFASGEYYSEFLGVNRGSTRVYQLGFLQDF